MFFQRFVFIAMSFLHNGFIAMSFLHNGFIAMFFSAHSSFRSYHSCFKAKFHAFTTHVSLQRVFNTHTHQYTLVYCKQFSAHCFYGNVFKAKWFHGKRFLVHICYGKWRQHNGFTTMSILHIGNVLCCFFHAMLLSHCCFMAKFLFRHIGFMAIPFFSTLVSWQLHF